MAHDPDGFNRWEAGQTLARDVLLEMARTAIAGRKPEPEPILVDAVGEVLARADEDRAFAAQILVPPLESELAAVMQPADPEALFAARTGYLRAMAQAHGDAFRRLYHSLADSGPYRPDAESAGRRALRNVCLRYLTAADDDEAAALADAHYRAASNMTDMMAGLAQLARMDFRRRDDAFAHFHDRFRNDALVLDKWLALQASSPLPGTANGVRALMHHPFFDIANPNRVRALIGAFAGNHRRFHAADGEGYRLVGEVLRTLDGINAQVAARMAGAFETWRRYDKDRQGLMRAELEAILAMPDRSSNIFEVATKMLG
jgi:aminopeptidase N